MTSAADDYLSVLAMWAAFFESVNSPVGSVNQEPPPKTSQEVRAEFIASGQSVAGWSREHKANPRLVYAILSATSRRRCLRGESHRIAVLLGLKRGTLRAHPTKGAA